MPATTRLAPSPAELQTLLAVGRLLGSAGDPGETLRGLLPLLGETFGIARGSLTLVDPATEAVRGRFGFHLDAEAVASAHHAAVDGALGEIILHLEDGAPAELVVREDAGVGEDGRALTLYCVPVLFQTRLAALLSVHKAADDAEAARRDADVLRVVADMLGQALRLHDTLAELADVKSEAEAILQSMTNAVIAIDNWGHVTSLNAAAQKMLGVSAETGLYHPYRETLDGHRGLVRIVDSILGTDPGQTSADLTIFPPVGDPIPANLVWSRLRDRTGEASGIVITLQDRTELRRLERQVRRAQRLAALGTMAAGVAHEVRNPLSAIRGAAQLAAKRVGEDERLATYVDLIQTETERLDGIVEQLLRFSRPQKPTARPTVLREVVEHALGLVRAQAQAADVVCAVEEAVSVPLVRADHNLLTQVFLNLFLNALQAMPTGGRLTIRLLTDTGRLPGQRVAVAEVRDTGCGMDRQTIEQLFTPFFTTKPEGTGLGLATAHRIMEDHGGGLDVISLPHDGSTFFVTLPIPEEEDDA